MDKKLNALQAYIQQLVDNGEHSSLSEAIKQRCIWCDDEAVEQVDGTREVKNEGKYDNCYQVVKYQDKHFGVAWCENHMDWEETEIDEYGLELRNLIEVEQREVTTVQWVPNHQQEGD